MPKTKRYRKIKRSKRRRHCKKQMGSGLTDKIRKRTQKYSDRKTVGRTFVDKDIADTIYQQKQDKEQWIDNGQMFDSNFGPGSQDFYQGPSIKLNNYVSKAIPHGPNGSIDYATGDNYTGDFVKGKREGKGTLTINNGPKYTGQWSNDSFVPLVNWKKTLKNKK